ncbi:MAG: tryptophan-rich sensory protein [Flavobacteriaceae bacterium]
MKKTLQISNGIAYVSMIFINYLSNTGLINGNTNASISRDVQNLFTPAGYAFSIWGLIYLLVLGFVIYQGLGLFKKSLDNDVASKVGIWFVISCVANGLWLFAWLHEFLGLSVLVMLVLLYSLIKIVVRTRKEHLNPSFKIILFLWWPFGIYVGWISVALIANVAGYLTQIDWNGFGLSSAFWSLTMILIAGALNLFITWKRNMREFAFVGAWALTAIAIANREVDQTISYTATVVAVILVLSSILHAFKKWKVVPLFQKK